ncbi:50S ribosomal protein L9 [Paramagnetospirillum kuznetsovii]|uniref:Large ribosomal subunit protein bL9 n=1 Tax=Paramagnetospirillum kuznetsovii TaxID=2053833 RepID=A0A364NYP4_9PROT|nr:50S ribosomal protein L9 [Paramagnetospirillum kuznetsovii]RAU22204.1 50S ribosomal protein L9 [Paramagnetospirillum kuznetsovii]
MEVILLERIEKLGQMGDVVNVKPGFARNFLLPQKKALRSSKENLAFFEKQRAQLEAANLKRRDEAQAVAAKMDGLSVLMVRQAGESGQLYGSVSGKDVADAIKAGGYTVERRQVNLDNPIKTLGSYAVRVSLHPEVAVTVTVNVARSQEEAERAAAAAAAANAAPVEAEEAPAEVEDVVEEAEEAAQE